MKSQIVEYILSLFSEDATRNMADQLGENHKSVKNALEGIIPTIIRGFASKSAEGPEQVNHLLSLATGAHSSSWFQTASSWFTGSDLMSKGEEIMNDIFGNKNVDRIASNVAEKNGIKTSSAFSLLKWAAPLALGAIGKFIGDGKINAGSLGSWFAKEKLNLDALVPATAAASTASIPSANSAPAANVHTAYSTNKKKGSRMWLPLLLLLLAGGLIWWFMKGCNGKDDGAAATGNDTMQMVTDATTTTTTTTTTTVTTPTFKMDADSTLSYVYGDMTTITLPDGVTLNVPGNGAEAMLVTNIKNAMSNGLDTTEEGKKAGWINLYDVQFSKMLTFRTGAADQVANIGKILKAYPMVHIKLGGYTDNTGNNDINQKLSQQRAEKVMKELAAAGVAAQVEKAEGYGSEFPVADNATAEGRAQNRRVSCRIVSIAK